MLLSEAIIAGGLLGPQIKFGYVEADGDGTCALGGALVAVGRREVCFQDTPDSAVFPSLGIVCSMLHQNACDREHRACTVQDVGDFIAHLNDCLGWTRSRIAVWVVANNLDCEVVLSDPAPEPAPEHVEAV